MQLSKKELEICKIMTKNIMPSNLSFFDNELSPAMVKQCKDLIKGIKELKENNLIY
jgi:hypothetical protein